MVASLVAAVLVTAPVSESAHASSGIAFADGNCDLNSAGVLGSGSEDDPYQIADGPALWEIPDCSTTGSPAVSAHFKLMTDIDLSGLTDAPTSSPIGYTSSGWVSFSGVLDGSNHSITGLNIDTDQEFQDSIGLFSELSGATIRNLTVSGTVIYQDTGTNVVVGGLAGLGTDVIFENVASYLNVRGRDYVGGFVGYGYGSLLVTNSESFGDVYAEGSTPGISGGFAGVLEAESFTISESINDGTVYGHLYSGGFLGFAPSSSASIDNSLNDGHVLIGAFGTGAAAGFVAELGGSFSITDSENRGLITGRDYGAGFVALATSGSASIVNSTNSGYVGVSGDPGISAGFVADISGGFSIIDSANTNNIWGNDVSGGFIGLSTQGNGLIENSFNSGDVIAPGSPGTSGGLVGKLQGNVSIIESENSGDIAGIDYVGGLVGSAPQGSVSIQGSNNLGGILAIGSHAGGFAGGVGSEVTISGSSNSGSITGSNFVGGFIGSVMRDFSISGSINTGPITGSNFVAGFVGYSPLGNGYIHSARNAGEVAASGDPGYAGGFVGAVGIDIYIFYSENSVAVKGMDYAGGFVGITGGDVEIEFSSNSGTIDALFVGGFIGEVGRFLTIATSINSGTIQGQAMGASGGLVGKLSESGTIASSMNAGSISNSVTGGGLVGWVAGELIVSGSVNTGNLFGGGTLGGLVGQSDGDIDVLGSKNSGSISQTDYAGGFVGYLYQVGTFENSYNSGAISGSNSAGGFAGFAGDGVAIGNSYNSGEISGGNREDGLIGFHSSGNTFTTASAFSLVDSSYVETSNIEDMKVSTFFNGWDFDNIWGFGGCSQNSGLPMLRMVDFYQTFYSDSCFDAPVQSQNTPVSASSPDAPAYSGPTITSPAQVVTPGSLVAISGTRLSSVTSVQLDGVSMPLVAVNDGSITFRVASSTSPGFLDLTLVSGFGSLTLMDHIRIVAAGVGVEGDIVSTKSDLVGKTKVLPGKASAKSQISPVQSERIRNLLVGSGLKKIVCTAIVSADMTTHQRVIVRKLAVSACQRASQLLPTASVWVQSKFTVHRSFAGKVALTFKG